MRLHKLQKKLPEIQIEMSSFNEKVLGTNKLITVALNKCLQANASQQQVIAPI